MSEAVVDCRGLELAYGDAPILSDVDLQVDRGEIVTVMGGSGSGKSTLLRAVAGLLPPRRGTVSLFGRDLYGVSEGERVSLLRRTGMLFQQGALFGSMSALENVLLPLRELTGLPQPVMVEVALMKLTLVGMAELAPRLPAELSGGQRKRVALARAVVLDPELVFCDEPTAGLDPVSAAAIDALLRRLRDVLGLTIVAVTHDVDTVRTIADRGVMLGNGRIVAIGGVQELETSGVPDVHAFFHRLSRKAELPAQVMEQP